MWLLALFTSLFVYVNAVPVTMGFVSMLIWGPNATLSIFATPYFGEYKFDVNRNKKEPAQCHSDIWYINWLSM